MAKTYSTYEAKAKFTEILRKVRAGERILISYRGEEVAELRPLTRKPISLEGHWRRLEEEGVVGPCSLPPHDLQPVVRKPGALKRFLQSRD